MTDLFWCYYLTLGEIHLDNELVSKSLTREEIMKCSADTRYGLNCEGKFYSRDGVALCAIHYQAKYAFDYSDPKQYEAIICYGCGSNIAREYNHYC